MLLAVGNDTVLQLTCYNLQQLCRQYTPQLEEFIFIVKKMTFAFTEDTKPSDCFNVRTFSSS